MILGILDRWAKFGARETFDTILSRNRGIGPGFDILRILLATVIFIGHARWLAGGAGMHIGRVADAAATATHVIHPVRQAIAFTGPMKPVLLALVPMFFAVSGFLVLGSAVRLRATSTFLAYRALRIFPALVVEIVLSAFVLGPFLTSLPITDYFQSSELWRYLGNAFGYITYVLPGVFDRNIVPDVVNATLWTLPSELYCYTIIALLMITRLAYCKITFSIIFIVITMILAGRHLLTGFSTPQGPYTDHVIVYYFLVGMMFYHWRNTIPVRWEMFIFSVVLSYYLLMYDSLIYVAPLPLVYGTLFFGLLPLPKITVLNKGDYSYGIYLYGCPITQSILAVWPTTFGYHSALLIPTAFAATVVVAALSWNAIERHALGLKRKLPIRFFPINKVVASFEQKRLGGGAA